MKSSRQAPAPLARRPVVFLDIDGVLVTVRSLTGRWPRIRSKHENGSWQQADPLCLWALRWLLWRTDAAVVLSSSWRGLSVDRRTVEIFRSWGLAPPASVTPYLPDRPRGREIASWRRWRRHRGRFVILDDDSDMAGLADHLVQCDMAYGLTWNLAAAAAEMLLGTSS